MAKPIISFLLILICLISACTPSNKPTLDQNDPILLNYDLRETQMDQPIIENIQTIQLKSQQQDVFVVQPIKAMIEGGKIYILDVNSQLTAFDTSGHYLTQVGKLGKGPGEFLDIQDFGIDEDNIIIHSSRNKALHYYRKEDHQYLYSQKVPFYANKFFKNKNGFVFYMGNNPPSMESDSQYNLYWTDPQMKPHTKQFWYELSKNLDSRSGTAFASSEKEHYLYHPAYSDTIFTANHQKTKAKYIINLPNPVPVPSRPLDIFSELPFEQSVAYSFLKPSMEETRDHFFFFFQYQRRINTPGLYLKTKEKFYAADELREHEYIFKAIGELLGTYEDQFIFAMRPETIRFLMSKDSTFTEQVKSGRYGALDTLLETIDSKDDPVILLVRFAS